MVASILGKNTDTGNLVTLEHDARLRGLYVIGKPGSGKTTLLVNLVVQDIQQGMGVCFLDPHGDAITDILARIPAGRAKDVILLDPFDRGYAFGLNLYQCDNPFDIESFSYTVDYVLQVFAKLFAEGDLSKTPQMAQVLRTTAITLIENPGMTMAEIPLLLNNEDARTKLVRNLNNTQALNFWKAYDRWKTEKQDEKTSSTLNKIDEFLSLPVIQHIVGQSLSTLDFRDIMDSGKILLVKLPARLEQVSSLIGSIIIGQLLNAAYSRADTPSYKRKQFCLYADEYQRFATPDFATLLVEARKFGVATTVAHQFRNQLDVKNKGATLNAATLVIFAVSGEDAEELSKQFKAEPQPTEPRVEPVRTVTTDPIGWLCSGRGHVHPEVNTFTQSTLMPFYHDLREYGTKVFPWSTTSLMNSYEVLNRYFYEVMVEAKAKGFTPHKITDADYTHASDLEIAKRFPMARILLQVVPREAFIHLAWASEKYSKDTKECREILTASQVLRDRMYGKLSRNWNEVDQAFERAIEVYPFLWNTIISPLRDRQSEGSSKVALDAIEQALDVYNASVPQREKSDLNYVPYLEYDEIHKKITILKAFVQEFKEFLFGLAIFPIEETSGHYEEKPGLPETIANAQARIANELTNPKKKYTAWVKLESGKEHIIEIERTETFLTAAAPSVVLAMQQNIVNQTRQNYCTKRSNVEQEIAARQEELTKPLKRAARTRQDEEEKEPVTKLSPAQQKKLDNMRAALGQVDYNLFMKDRQVQEYLELLLEKGVDAERISRQLDRWRKAGSPSDVSPFAELIKSLLG